MTMMTTMGANKFTGVITALVTPFKNGAIDKTSFVRLIRRQVAEGAQGFVINGTTGESPTLKLNEVRELFELAKNEAEIPLIVGAGTNSTATTADLCREVSQWKPEALLVVVPYYNRPSQRGLREHFVRVAESSSVPVLLYDVPSRTMTGLAPETVGELSRQKNIAGIKDATGAMENLKKIKAASTENFNLLSGDDASCVDFMIGGGHGVISVSSAIICSEMREFFQFAKSDPKAASAEYRAKYADLMKWLFIEANPVPLKMALHWMGVIDSPELRLPLVPLDEKFHKDFKACLKNLGKI
jgi:4-hydroxy-tetrahydrodipicolinate synthase